MNLIKFLYEEHDDPQVTIPGGGTMLLSQIERNIRGKNNDLFKAINSAKTAEDWERVDAMMDRGWMQSAIKAVAKAKRGQQ